MEVFNSSLEANLDAWTPAVTGGVASVSHVTPGLAGTAGAARFIFDSSTSNCILIRTIAAMTTQTDARFRAYLTIDSLTLGDTQSFYALAWNEGTTVWGGCQLRFASGSLFVRHVRRTDGLTFGSNDVNITTNKPAWIELWYKKATTNSSNDAISRMYFGGGAFAATGELVSTLSGYDFFDAFLLPTTFRFGISVVSVSGSSGTLRFDEIAFRDDDAVIGALPSSLIASKHLGLDLGLHL